jgi:hypothetical protein
MHLALEVVGNAGEPLPPRHAIAARNALAHLLQDPETSEDEKDEAVAALARLNLPLLARGALARLKLLGGVQVPQEQRKRVEPITLNESGFGCVRHVPPDAQCWVRPRHGSILALEIAELCRGKPVSTGDVLAVSSASADWTLRIEPVAVGQGTCGLSVALQVEPGLAFSSQGFAAVLHPEGNGGAEWYVAALDERGHGEFPALPVARRFSLHLALAPHATATRIPRHDVSAATQIRAEGSQGRLHLETRDPVLQMSRGVLVRQERAGGAAFLPDTSFEWVSGPQGWEAEATFALSSLVPRVRGAQPIRTKGAVRTRGAKPPSAVGPSPTGQFSCLVLL